VVLEFVDPKNYKRIKEAQYLHNMDIKGLLLKGFVQDKLSLFLKKSFTFPIPRALLILPNSSK
jgi:hypothetical protein